MTAATDFRQIRLSREVRDWLATGSVSLRQVASDLQADLSLVTLEQIDECAYACETVVDEFDAADGGGAT